jgi:sortase (surface protein transpeptidase)
LIRLVTLLAGAVLLVGCAIAPDEPPAQSSGAPTATIPVPAVVPTEITIPAIDARSTLVPLGLDPATGELVPTPTDQPMQAGYYAGPDPAFEGDEVLPGEVGPAVIAGHVDGEIGGRKGQPGIFYRLHELRPGDEVFVTRDGASTLRFLVDRLERYPKDAFPTSRVYGNTTGPELRLITCGGEFDHGEGHYRDNWVVYARLAGELP